MDNILEETYGRGWAFPPSFSLRDGASMASGGEDVRQSLIILFGTLPGERIMRKNYGCDLNQFMFANIRNELATQIKSEIIDSVLSFESRAEVTSIDISTSPTPPNELNIQVVYRLRGSDISQRVSGSIDSRNGHSIFYRF